MKTLAVVVQLIFSTLVFAHTIPQVPYQQQVCVCVGSSGNGLGNVTSIWQCITVAQLAGDGPGRVPSCDIDNSGNLMSCACREPSGNGLGYVNSFEDCMAVAQSQGFPYGTLIGCHF